MTSTSERRREMDEVGLSRAVWHRSSYSGGNGNCVEVAHPAPGVVAVRDSKDPGGPELAFIPEQWTAFTQSLKRAPR